MKSKPFLSSVLWVTLGVFGCRGAHDATREEGESTAVAVHMARKDAVGQRYVASGTLRGRQTAVLTSKAPGYVQEIRFKPGERVRTGQVLFVLEDSELGARLRAAQAGLEGARQALSEAENGLKAAQANARVATATHERFKTLQEKRAVAEQEFDEVEGKYVAAIAEKDMAQARVARMGSALEQAEAEVAAVRSYTQITAPFSGRFTERLIDVGNLAAPGTPLGVVEQGGSLRAEASVEESHAGKIRVGDSAEVMIEGASRALRGRVSEVNQGVDVATRAFTVRVDIDEDSSTLAGVSPHPGMFVRVGFDVGEAQRILIPTSAVFRKGQLEMVYVVEEERARLRLVTVGAQRGQSLEVLSGLSDGDVVVAEPGQVAREGVRVVTQ